MSEKKPVSPQEASTSAKHSAEDKRFPLVGIGASAGGLDAFKQFFAAMPGDPGMAFVLVPHLDPHHKSMMTEILGRCSTMPIHEVSQATVIENNHIYIIQANSNLAVKEGMLVPTPLSRQQGINLPVDIFFSSLAQAKKELAIGIILSGTMGDGSQGIKEIKELGGLVIAQSTDTAQHSGMPQSAINTGLVDLILPVEKMPDALLAYSRHPYIHGAPLEEKKDELQQVLTVVHARSNNDFRCYKRNTLLRRTERRMGLCQIQNMAEYVRRLREDPQEVDALLKDLLIGVTGFFREPKMWEELQQSILPSLVDSDKTYLSLRAWVPGCSTGEEAFTIAILLFEACEQAGRSFEGQIFATDIDSKAINTARLGIYPETIAGNVPSAYLKKYFTLEGGEYHILRHIRESVVFAEQNLLLDAPFSNLDLISCRNLLIYLNPDVQKKILELFAFALRPEGCLILGSSETIGNQRNHFEVISKENRLYRRTRHIDSHRQMPVLQYFNRHRAMDKDRRMDLAPKSVSDIMHRQLIKRFAPAAILINKNFEILNLNGPTSLYLDLPQGEPVMDLTAMIKDGMRLKLRAALHKAIKKDEIVTVDKVRIRRDNHYFRVTFTVAPLQEPGLLDPLYLISFLDLPVPEEKTGPAEEPDPGEEPMIRQLESELVDTRLELQNTIEELETSNEELKASNEEMMSMNEELQSSNEELETSKEELQSMNEELSTVNAELQDKIRELETASNDMANLMNSTRVATVFLDLDLTIRRFTPAATELFNLIPTDIGRPIADLSMRFQDADLHAHATQVLNTLEVVSKEVEAEAGRWFIRRILPFRTQAGQISGLVLTFAEVTQLKMTELTIRRNEQELQEKSELLAAVLEHTHMMAVYLDANFNFLWVNTAYANTCQKNPSFFPGKNHFKLYPNEENEAIFRKVTETGQPFYVQAKSFEFPDQPERGTTYWDWSLVPTKNADGNVTGLVFTLTEVTARIKAEKSIRENEERFRSLFENMTSGMAIYEAIDNGKDFRFNALNKAAEVIDAIDREKIIGKHLQEVFPGAEEFGLQKVLHRVWQTGIPETIHGRHYQDDRIQGWRDNKIYKLSSGELVAIYEDATERKESELALTQERELFKAIVDRIPVMLTRYDESRNMLFLNREFERLVGWTTQEVQHMDMMEKVYPDPEYRQKAYAYMKKASSEWHHFRLHSKSGKIIESEWSNIQLEDGTSVGIGIDTTQRKQAEKDKRESETQFRQFFENLTIGVAVYEPIDDGSDFVFFDMNPAGQKLSQVSIDDIRGKKLTEIFPGAHELGLFKALQKTWETGQSYHVPIKKYEDERITQWVKNRVFKIPSGRIIAVYDDRTEVMRLEEKLLQAQRLESIGRLAGGVAHDFNNMLSIISGNAELMLEDMLDSDSMLPNLKEIQKAADRSKDLTQQLLAFARKQTILPEICDLNKTIQGLLNMLGRLIGEDIDLIWKARKGLWPVKVDPSQINQILANLCVNAKDAISGFGKIIIETDNVTFDEQYCTNNDGFEPGEFVRVCVSDNGCGMEQDVLENLFDPFFTTKSFGKGTGLGLSTVYGIIKQNNGFIHVQSQLKIGTVFTLYFPKSKQCSIIEKKNLAKGSVIGGTETILLVEDEEPILRTTKIMLERLGYRVFTAADPSEAIRLVESYPDQIHLLISDVVMPEMNGKDLAEEILSRRPRMRCLFMSGYTDDAIACHGVLDEDIHFINKPFSRAELSKIVRDILDQPGNQPDNRHDQSSQ